MSGFKPLNPYQEKAVKEALSKPFTLVQGPPGKQKNNSACVTPYRRVLMSGFGAKRGMVLSAVLFSSWCVPAFHFVAVSQNYPDDHSLCRRQ